MRPTVKSALRALAQFESAEARTCLAGCRSAISQKASELEDARMRLIQSGSSALAARLFAPAVQRSGYRRSSSSFNSDTVNQTQTRLAASSRAVITNTQRMPKPAAIPPPIKGPKELPRKVAEDVIP